MANRRRTPGALLVPAADPAITGFSLTHVDGTTAQQTDFYTALYHAELFPSVLSDADGSYRGFDGAVHTVAPGHSNEYADFSNWDIYRSQAQLTALTDPAAASDMAQSIVDAYQQGGTLTKWGMDNGETYIMVGDSGVPVLAGYYAFGATHFDTATALAAMATEQTTDTDVTPGVTYLDSFGYLPTNSIYGCCRGPGNWPPRTRSGYPGQAGSA